jgi:hypothetical protein
MLGAEGRSLELYGNFPLLAWKRNEHARVFILANRINQLVKVFGKRLPNK